MSEAEHHHTHHGGSAQTVHDPVCGMDIDPKDAVGTFEYKGRTYHFCAEYCLDKFKADPENFLGVEPTKTPSSAPHRGPVVYLCPMDPDVRSPTPAACPKCG